jgi:hypothetical protein
MGVSLVVRSSTRPALTTLESGRKVSPTVRITGRYASRVQDTQCGQRMRPEEVEP